MVPSWAPAGASLGPLLGPSSGALGALLGPSEGLGGRSFGDSFRTLRTRPSSGRYQSPSGPVLGPPGTQKSLKNHRFFNNFRLPSFLTLGPLLEPSGAPLGLVLGTPGGLRRACRGPRWASEGCPNKHSPTCPFLGTRVRPKKAQEGIQPCACPVRSDAMGEDFFGLKRSTPSGRFPSSSRGDEGPPWRPKREARKKVPGQVGI